MGRSKEYLEWGKSSRKREGVEVGKGKTRKGVVNLYYILVDRILFCLIELRV